MSRQRIQMVDGSLLCIGYDPSYATWYAQHYDDADENAPPRLAIGYSPDEQALLRAERPDALIGSFPVADEGLERMLSVELYELGGEIFEPPPDGQPSCWVLQTAAVGTQ